MEEGEGSLSFPARVADRKLERILTTMKQRLMTGFQRFVRDEEGQSTTEYILILAVVVMIAMKFKDQVGKLIGVRIDKLESDMTKFDQL